MQAAPPYTSEIAQAHNARLAVVAAATPVHRGRGETVGTLIGAVLSFPSDLLLQQPARTLIEAATSVWASVKAARQTPGIARIVANAALPLAAMFLALAFILQQLARVIDAPFAVIRIAAAAAGNALTPERVVLEDRGHRVAPQAWPRLPSNAASETTVARYLAKHEHHEADVIVVPGYTSDSETKALSRIAETRLRIAMQDYRSGRAPFIMVSGGNVHPRGTPFNEAFEMRRYLIANGIPGDAILLEPFATHSHTNLRNAGRLMRQLGLTHAIVVSSGTPLIGQSRIFAIPSSFGGGVDVRAHLNFGVGFGSFHAIDPTHTRYTPSVDVDLAIATDPVDP